MNFFCDLFKDDSLYFDMLDRLQEAIFICDKEEHIIYFNKASQELDGYKLEDVKNKKVSKLYNINKENSPLLRALYTECPVYNEEITYIVNGKEIVQSCNTSPIYRDGQIIGAYSIQRDITSIKEIVERNINLQDEILNAREHFTSLSEKDPFKEIKGHSKNFNACKVMAWQAAKTDSSVLLVGETGCGKEVFARAIHEHSNRSQKPFLALNCAAIPESLLEGILFGTTRGVYTGAVEKEGILSRAMGGTVFLDEINSMSLLSQAKLLRVLEEKKVMKLGSEKEKPIDIRLISSTNEIPQQALELKHLREDLFYRLSVIQISIPPLRLRKDDIPELTAHFIQKYNLRFEKNICKVSTQVMDYFQSYSWPGNVRQLKACVESAMNFAENGKEITMSDLPQYIFDNNQGASTHQVLKIHMPEINSQSSAQINKNTESNQKEFSCKELRIIAEEDERKKIASVLKQNNGQISKAAKQLGISKQLLYYRIKKYNLK